MKTSELRQLIREELESLGEGKSNPTANAIDDARDFASKAGAKCLTAFKSAGGDSKKKIESAYEAFQKGIKLLAEARSLALNEGTTSTHPLNEGSTPKINNAIIKAIQLSGYGRTGTGEKGWERKMQQKLQVMLLDSILDNLYSTQFIISKIGNINAIAPDDGEFTMTADVVVDYPDANVSFKKKLKYKRSVAKRINKLTLENVDTDGTHPLKENYARLFEGIDARLTESPRYDASRLYDKGVKGVEPPIYDKGVKGRALKPKEALRVFNRGRRPIYVDTHEYGRVKITDVFVLKKNGEYWMDIYLTEPNPDELIDSGVFKDGDICAIGENKNHSELRFNLSNPKDRVYGLTIHATDITK